MPNMSYCRFENTYPDLADCEEALANGEELSESEARYAVYLVKLCKEIAQNYIYDGWEEDLKGENA